MQVHLGVQAAISSEHRRQRGEHCRADKSNPQKAFLAATDAARLFHVLLHVAEGSPGSLEKDLSGAGEFYSTRCSEKELISKDLLELSYLLREWRLGKVKAQGGASKVQLLGDRYEVAQMTKLDISIHIQNIIIGTNKILDVSERRA